MLESNKRRILVFKNGKGTEGVEIVADAQRFEEVKKNENHKRITLKYSFNSFSF